jgi:hypothetical protein
MTMTIAQEQAAEQTLITGMQSRLPATFTMTLAGQKLTRAQILAMLQARIDARNSVTSTRGAWKLALSQLAALIATDQPTMVALKRLLLAMFAGQDDALSDLGLSEPKTATRTVAEKQAAQVKAKATREARHTMGPKAKLAITGAVAPEAPAAAPTATTGTAPAIAPASSGSGTTGHS